MSKHLSSEPPATPRFGLAPGGFRLPDATRLGTVTLQVADLGRSLDFYGQMLGFRADRIAGGGALLQPQGDPRTLVHLVERRGARPVPRRGVLGLYHFAVLLPDRRSLGQLVRHLIERGVHVSAADHAVSEAIYLADPDGLGIEVYADRPRASWRVDDRQLVMTTESLDVRDLLEAAGPGRWSGMPPATVMGHVHLSVGDLDEAAAFYHSGLGFDKVVWDYPGALFLSAGGYHHHLGTNTWSPGPPAAEDQARLLSWDILVPPAAAAAAAENLSRAGYIVRTEGPAWRATDPWGTPVRIVPILEEN